MKMRESVRDVRNAMTSGGGEERSAWLVRSVRSEECTPNTPPVTAWVWWLAQLWSGVTGSHITSVKLSNNVIVIASCRSGVLSVLWPCLPAGTGQWKYPVPTNQPAMLLLLMLEDYIQFGGKCVEITNDLRFRSIWCTISIFYNFLASKPN